MNASSQSHLKRYKAGEMIFRTGDSSECAYLIEEGIVDIIVNEDDEPINVLHTGDLLGEMGVVDQNPRSISARAKTAVVLLEIRQSQITDRLKHSDPIIRSLVEVLLSRLRTLLPTNTQPSTTKRKRNKAKLKDENQGISKFKLESELRAAIELGDVQTVYQPIQNLQNNCVAGFEALSRWSHPIKGFMSPAEFIALAEETDLILEVGYLVFNRACDLLLKIPGDKFININVSVKQIDNDDFLNEIHRIVSSKGINPERLKLEITETMVVDYKRAKQWIRKCKKLGFPICADDFGTGHSGIQQLAELDFDVLKVDQLFVKNMFLNEKFTIILDSIVDMAKKLDIKLVAEGIELEQQLLKLSQMGFDYGQGYYFGKAVAMNQAINLINP